MYWFLGQWQWWLIICIDYFTWPIHFVPSSSFQNKAFTLLAGSDKHGDSFVQLQARGTFIDICTWDSLHTSCFSRNRWVRCPTDFPSQLRHHVGNSVVTRVCDYINSDQLLFLNTYYFSFFKFFLRCQTSFTLFCPCSRAYDLCGWLTDRVMVILTIN